jgi:histidinol-phosphate phosphatase family protein
MKNKAILLDRDGTINVDVGSPHKIEDLRIIPLAIEGLRFLQERFKLIIITNQSGIGRGYYTEEDYFAFRNEMYKELKEQGVTIDAEYFCPHTSKDNCDCRKPKTGMLEHAAKDFDLDLTQSWMIGDRLPDIKAGKNAGCRTIHVLTGGYKESIKETDFTANNLLGASDYILNYTNK